MAFVECSTERRISDEFHILWFLACLVCALLGVFSHGDGILVAAKCQCHMPRFVKAVLSAAWPAHDIEPLMKTARHAWWQQWLPFGTVVDGAMCFYFVLAPCASIEAAVYSETFMVFLTARWAILLVGGRLHRQVSGWSGAVHYLLIMAVNCCLFLTCPRNQVGASTVVWVSAGPASAAALSPWSLLGSSVVGLSHFIATMREDCCEHVSSPGAAIGCFLLSCAASVVMLVVVDNDLRQKVRFSNSAEPCPVRTVLEAVCDAVVELDEELRIMEHERRLSDMLLMDPSASLKGINFAELTSDAENVPNLFNQEGVAEARKVDITVSQRQLRDSTTAFVLVELFHVLCTTTFQTRQLIGVRKVCAAGEAVDPADGEAANACNPEDAASIDPCVSPGSELKSASPQVERIVQQSIDDHRTGMDALTGFRVVFDGKLTVLRYEDRNGTVTFGNGESISDWLVDNDERMLFDLEHFASCIEILEAVRAGEDPATVQKDFQATWRLRSQGYTTRHTVMAQVSLTARVAPQSATYYTSSLSADPAQSPSTFTVADVHVTATFNGVCLARSSGSPSMPSASDSDADIMAESDQTYGWVPLSL